MTDYIDTEVLIDYYVKRLNKAKWQVIFRTEKGIQIKRLKQVNRLGIWSGLFLLPFWGIGLVIWLLVILDYVFQTEKIVFVTTDQMIRQFREAN